jgi:DNA-binding NarL/FixJ family response regulator
MKGILPKIIIAMIPVKDSDHLQQLLSEKKYAFISEESTIHDFKKALNAIRNDDQYVCNRLSKHLLNFISIHKESKVKHLLSGDQLTRREIEIVSLITQGFTSRKIAQKLSISAGTVDTHRRNILRKLGIRNAAALVKYAFTKEMNLIKH